MMLIDRLRDEEIRKLVFDAFGMVSLGKSATPLEREQAQLTLCSIIAELAARTRYVATPPGRLSFWRRMV